MGDKDGHKQGEDHQANSQAQTPGFQLPSRAVAVREHGSPATLKKWFLQDLHCSKEGQRVGQQRLGHEEEVHHSPDGGRQVICDDLFGGVCPSQVRHQGEEALQDAGGDVSPVHHAVELAGFRHVSLQGGEEDLRGVAEHDDADGDGELLNVDVKLDLIPGPVACPGEAVGDHEDVNDEVREGAEQAEFGHGLQVLQERARQERDRGHHGPGFLGDGEPREAVDHQVSADHHVQDARHDQLDDLSHVHDVPAQRGEAGRAAGIGDVNVGVPHAHLPSVLVLLIQTRD